MICTELINVGIVGIGHLGKFHLQQYLKISDVSVVGIYDINQELAKKIADLNNIKSYRSLENLCNDCDAISIVTPTISHYKIAIIALSFDCHIFIEKPICDNLNHAKKLNVKAKN